MEERIGEKLPGLRLIAPGLSIKVKTGLIYEGPNRRRRSSKMLRLRKENSDSTQKNSLRGSKDSSLFFKIYVLSLAVSNP